MWYLLASIAIITLVVWLLKRQKIVDVCPICAGTVLTWAWGLIAIYISTSKIEPLLVAVLMGASLGALAEKYGSRFGLWWKTFVVLLGLPAIYFLVTRQPKQAGVLLIILIIVTIWLKGSAGNKNNQKDLFKECC